MPGLDSVMIPTTVLLSMILGGVPFFWWARKQRRGQDKLDTDEGIVLGSFLVASLCIFAFFGVLFAALLNDLVGESVSPLFPASIVGLVASTTVALLNRLITEP